MKKQWTWLKRGIFLLLVIVIFRGTIFRMLIRYEAIDTRRCIELVDNNLIQLLDSQKYADDLNEIVALAQTITCEQLTFSTTNQTQNSNVLYQRGTAHCVGYAALFTSIMQYLLKKAKLDKQYTASHVVGQLYFLGLNMHNYWNSPFFKDHDYCMIVNNVTGKNIAIDATVNDYLGINQIAIK